MNSYIEISFKTLIKLYENIFLKLNQIMWFEMILINISETLLILISISGLDNKSWTNSTFSFSIDKCNAVLFNKSNTKFH